MWAEHTCGDKSIGLVVKYIQEGEMVIFLLSVCELSKWLYGIQVVLQIDDPVSRYCCADVMYESLPKGEVDIKCCLSMVLNILHHEIGYRDRYWCSHCSTVCLLVDVTMEGELCCLQTDLRHISNLANAQNGMLREGQVTLQSVPSHHNCQINMDSRKE